jgi:hypothetical protein
MAAPQQFAQAVDARKHHGQPVLGRIADALFGQLRAHGGQIGEQFGFAGEQAGQHLFRLALVVVALDDAQRGLAGHQAASCCWASPANSAGPACRA